MGTLDAYFNEPIIPGKYINNYILHKQKLLVSYRIGDYYNVMFDFDLQNIVDKCIRNIKYLDKYKYY